VRNTIDAIVAYGLLSVIFVGSFVGIIWGTIHWREQWERAMQAAERKYKERDA
jgi:hypothetical protein